MRAFGLLIGTGLILACGGAGTPEVVAVPPAEEVVEEPPPPPPPPACPFDLESVKTAGVVLNYAIDGQPEAWLRLSPLPDGREDGLHFEFERRDETGREVGVERYVCGPRGLALVASGHDGHEVVFAPPVLVVPVGGGSGGAVGTVTLTSADSNEGLDYTHAFEAVEEGESEFGSEHVTVLSTLTLAGDVPMTIETETVWALAPGFIGAVSRVQLVNGVEQAERLRTVVPRGGR